MVIHCSRYGFFAWSMWLWPIWYRPLLIRWGYDVYTLQGGTCWSAEAKFDEKPSKYMSLHFLIHIYCCTVMSMCADKLGGMNENSTTVAVPASCQDAQTICCRIYEVANVLLVSSSQPGTLLFAARSAATSSDVLVEVKVNEGRAALKVNCDKIVIGQMLLKELKTVLARIW